MYHGLTIYPSSTQYVQPSALMRDDLPLQLQHVLCEIRQLTSADDAITINSMLSAMSVAVQASTDIIDPLSNNNKVIPLSLFCITVAESGSRKSTVDDIFMSPFHDFEQEQEKENDKLNEEYDADKEVYDARLKSLRSKLKKAIDSEDVGDQKQYGDDIAAHKKSEPILVPKIRLLMSDTTQAKLQIELGKPWNKVCLSTDEAGKLINNRDFASPSYYNSLWGAKPQNIERTDDKSRRARAYRFSMNLMMQPTHFSKFIRLHGEKVKGDGFLARCLFSFAQPFQQQREPTTDRVETPHLDAFIARITALLNMANNKFRCGQFDEHRKLSIRNKRAVLDFQSQSERFLVTQMSQCPEFSPRATEHALRLAGVMHAFLCDDNDDVDDKILSAAFKMTIAFADRYQQAVNYNELSEELLQHLLGFINNHSYFVPQLGKNAVSKTYLLQNGPTKLRKKEQLDLALEALESFGKIRRERAHNGWYFFIPMPSHQITHTHRRD